MQAVDQDYCRDKGLEIARRVTGGGAVYMSPRMLAWDVVVDRTAFGADLESITTQICVGVAAGVSWFGVAARFRAPNDIEIDGLKVSGFSGYKDGRCAVLQGTVLIEDDVPPWHALCAFLSRHCVGASHASRMGLGAPRPWIECATVLCTN